MIVKTYIAGSDNKITNVKYTYGAGSHMIQMSDNVISFNIVSQLTPHREDIKSFTTGSNVLSILNESFIDCTELITITFSNKVQYIGNSAFQNNVNLQSVIFPESMRHIGAQAFYGCTSMPNVTFPSGKVHLGQSAFESCTNIQSINVNLADSSGGALFKNATKLQTASINGPLTYQMFYGDHQLRHLDFSPDITSIGAECFYGCASLTSLDLSNTRIASLPASFIFGTGIIELVVPASITTLNQLNQNCFAGTSLQNVYLRGFTDEYMKANKEGFSRFGAASNMFFYSSSGKKYSLKDDGNGLKTSITYVISIGIAKSSAGQTLPSMYNDIKKICDKISQVYPNASEDEIVYRKMGDGGDAQQRATIQNLNNCFAEAVQLDTELLIFHFSDHGGSGGYIVLQDGDYYNSALAQQFSKFKRVFAVLCCCYPWRNPDVSGGIVANSKNQMLMQQPDQPSKSMADDIIEHLKRIKQQQKQSLLAGNSQMLRATNFTDTKALIWCAGQAGVATVMAPGIGHLFMWAIEGRCNTSQTYAQVWDDCKNNSAVISPSEEKSIGVYGTRWDYRYEDREGFITHVVPRKVNYNFDENVRIFT